ncbi:hypothetical protein PG996_002536 [Apiospora saccharicola]|uniref:Protein kinase domain-containing protein n=1 Tax=Apiospora saccharicola TaxID=335842 RepID=A0ABR1WJR3_9PEZI
MAEAVGTALAVVGVLGQIFDGCVKAYGHFTTAAEFAEQSRGLACKLRIEEMRLVVWGRAWGVTEGKLEAHLMDVYGGNSPTRPSMGTGPGPGPLGGEGQAGVMMRSLAVQILSELHRTITDGQRLRERYGLVDEEEKGSSSTNGSKKGGAAVGGKEALVKRPSESGKSGGGSNDTKSEWSWRKEVSIRARWVVAGKSDSNLVIYDFLHACKTATIGKKYTEIPFFHCATDKDKFTSLLQDLKDYNDGLEQLFPASRIPALQRTWVAELLQSARRDPARARQRRRLPAPPRLHASANLKKLRINPDNEPHGKACFQPTFAFRVARAALTVSDRDPKRSEGLHQPNDDKDKSENVLIEWVPYDRQDLDEKFVHLRRLDQLARMMSSATLRHPDLHTIDCLGYTDDLSLSRYGLVYKSPHPTHATLHRLIATPDLKTPDLDERVKLARTLAVALWSLHALDWLHKSLCSHNILFFPSATTQAATQPTATAAMVPDISTPYLVGFDASRPDLDIDMSVAPSKSPGPSILNDLHRHPNSLTSGCLSAQRRPYCKSYDIYSLGLVLLEIGLWKPLQTYYKPHYTAERWRDRVVLPVLVPGLGNRTGRVYREVVERCLTAPDDDNMSGEEAGLLMEGVVAALESIHV